MTTRNEELLQKAVITTDDLASAGKLPADYANQFLDFVVDETALKGNARIVKIKGDSWEVHKLGVGSRNAVLATEGQDPGIRRGVTPSKVTLTHREIMIPFDLTDSFQEESIEGASVASTVAKLMARAFANDMEELLISGDLLGPAALQSTLLSGGSSTLYVKDTYLGAFDGLLRKADSGNQYDAEGAAIGPSVISGAIRAMPTKFRRNRANLRTLVSPDLSQIMLERFSARGTPVGDAALKGTPVTPFGVPFVELPLMQFQPTVVEHITLTGTTPVALRYAPVSDVVVTKTTIGSTPEAAYAVTTDYTVTEATGTIVRVGGGSITSGQTVKVTYSANPQMVMTPRNNIIIGIGRDIRLEKDRNIHRRATEYVLTAKVGFAVEEDTALVKVSNLATTV